MDHWHDSLCTQWSVVTLLCFLCRCKRDMIKTHQTDTFVPMWHRPNCTLRSGIWRFKTNLHLICTQVEMLWRLKQKLIVMIRLSIHMMTGQVLVCLSSSSSSSVYAGLRTLSSVSIRGRALLCSCYDSVVSTFISCFCFVFLLLIFIPILPPLGHVWDVMLVWRKGNINETVSVLQYCVPV